MRRDESRTDLGVVSIHKNVISSIATLAACDIEGVKEVGRDLKARIVQLISRRPLSSIRVEIDKNEEVRIEIPLIIKYGFNIPEIADRVQENVRAALEKMTNLTIKDININVQGIERGQG
jgi:uncharacterized alkaline shock family protein YloU